MVRDNPKIKMTCSNIQQKKINLEDLNNTKDNWISNGQGTIGKNWQAKYIQYIIISVEIEETEN